jgi:hypothetical protein
VEPPALDPDDPLDILADAPEPGSAPPLRGKVHPPAEMDDATPSLDDEVTRFHRPRDETATTFGFYPEAADAAADLAGDLGSTFLEGATRGEDMSELALSSEEREADPDLPLVIDEDQMGAFGAEGPLRPIGLVSRARPRRGARARPPRRRRGG